MSVSRTARGTIVPFRYGIAGLPTTSAYVWFSITTTTMRSGRSLDGAPRAPVAETAGGVTEALGGWLPWRTVARSAGGGEVQAPTASTTARRSDAIRGVTPLRY